MMACVVVIDGEFGFAGEFALELSVISQGPEAARAHIRDLLGTTTDEVLRSLLTEMDQRPALVPTSLAEVYARAAALTYEVGCALHEELRKVDYPVKEMGILDAVFFDGLTDDALGREDKRDSFIGVARMSYVAGTIVSSIVRAVFPEDDAPTPDIDEHLAAFMRGVYEGRAA